MLCAHRLSSYKSKTSSVNNIYFTDFAFENFNIVDGNARAIWFVIQLRSIVIPYALKNEAVFRVILTFLPLYSPNAIIRATFQDGCECVSLFYGDHIFIHNNLRDNILLVWIYATKRLVISDPSFSETENFFNENLCEHGIELGSGVLCI